MQPRNLLISLRRDVRPPPHRQALSRFRRLAVLGGVALLGGLAATALVPVLAATERTGPGSLDASPGSGDCAADILPKPADTLLRPASWQALLDESGATGRPLVVLFSIAGCGFCELVRHDHLRYLARDPEASAVLVAELDIFDRRPFTEGSSPAELAASLGIRAAPTVAFFGPDGELAQRLVGYNSADFYGAYLDRRMAAAITAMARPGAT